ncbi:hypothetical protein EWM62_01800 [Mucilaginibacter terrigena]|uniref:Uncharacterized protein n=1 Tax=Mucilaginibacter terrigena TaxID=2492395 RepID=A0A4Q5LS33_9SPHI|nr:hypothetical protein [Mucilaginibacter terrigena]RYU92193.1 hypothetical protein EWM62_01800 [Mucilaginibacter terrigena]
MATYNDNEEQNKPTAYEVKDDDNLEEKDLRRTAFMFGSEEKSGNEPGMEGNGEGGQSFGENSNTPSGDDKNNPSQNAGDNNGYFSRTEPSEEHPENNNFKDPNQLGQSNYTESTGAAPTGQSDSENAAPAKYGTNESNNDTEDNRNQSQQSYQEGTADGNDDVNIPGPNETPDQQKVGE